MAGFDTSQTHEVDERDGSLQGRNVAGYRSATTCHLGHAPKSVMQGPVCCQHCCQHCCRTGQMHSLVRVMTAGDGTVFKTCCVPKWARSRLRGHYGIPSYMKHCARRNSLGNPKCWVHPQLSSVEFLSPCFTAFHCPNLLLILSQPAAFTAASSC